MFDIGGGELLVIGIVALVVIGPKELPGLLRTAGNAMSKVRRMAAEFRGQFDDAMREAELDQAKKAFTDVSDAAHSATSSFNPLESIRNEIKSVKDEIKGAQNTVVTPVIADPVIATAVPVDLSPPNLAAPTVAAEAPAKAKRSRKKADETKADPLPGTAA
ncbi:MAG: Sec-independent protein translocase protein TatB [Beijerinckiaceae bacterium]